MDNLGAIFGPLLGIALVAAVGVRGAMLLSIIPGLLAVGAIVYVIRAAKGLLWTLVSPRLLSEDRAPRRPRPSVSGPAYAKAANMPHSRARRGQRPAR